MTATSGLILAAYGLWDFSQEVTDLRAATEHDLKLLGTAVEVSVENALRDGQAADVREVLDSLERKDATIDLFVFDTRQQLTASSSDGSPEPAFVRGTVAEVVAAGKAVAHFEGPQGLSHLVAAVPLKADDGTPMGVVALVRPLHEMRRDLLAMAASRLFTLLTVFAGLAAIGGLLIHVHVQRPLNRLGAAMTAVQGGDLRTTLQLEGKDELARVGAEFNAMVQQLQRAREHSAAEAESRRTLEAGLQRVDKLATVGQLSAGLAHEIGTPLQILNGRARSLAARADVGADVRRTAQILVDQSDRITSIVEQLLNFARKRSARVEQVSLKRPVQVIVDLLAPEARLKGVEIALADGGELPRILADPQQLQQVTLNLLTNALRATPRGGTVRVGLTASTFARAGGSAEPSVCLQVEDTGAGIAPHLLGRLFEPFFTTWEEVGGAGLGLAVVKSIVTEHEGEITVRSEAGQGTRFTVHFPLRARAPGLEEKVA